MELADLIEAILDQGIDNEITVTIKRVKSAYTSITIKDKFGEIGNVYEFFMDKALFEAQKQIQSFVDEQNNG